MRKGLIAAALLPLLLGGCLEKTASRHLKSALVESGLPEGTAGCMAGRMAGKLSIRQMLKLRALQDKHTLRQYVAAVRRIDDSEVIAVTASSAALCAAGLG